MLDLQPKVLKLQWFNGKNGPSYLGSVAQGRSFNIKTMPVQCVKHDDVMVQELSRSLGWESFVNLHGITYLHLYVMTAKCSKKVTQGPSLFQSFLMRKFYFNNQEDGFFKKTKRKVVPPSPMTGTSFPLFFLIQSTRNDMI